MTGMLIDIPDFGLWLFLDGLRCCHYEVSTDANTQLLIIHKYANIS